jgi:hypothetical protein
MFVGAHLLLDWQAPVRLVGAQPTMFNAKGGRMRDSFRGSDFRLDGSTSVQTSYKGAEDLS